MKEIGDEMTTTGHLTSVRLPTFMVVIYHKCHFINHLILNNNIYPNSILTHCYQRSNCISICILLTEIASVIPKPSCGVGRILTYVASQFSIVLLYQVGMALHSFSSLLLIMRSQKYIISSKIINLQTFTSTATYATNRC